MKKILSLIIVLFLSGCKIATLIQPEKSPLPASTETAPINTPIPKMLLTEAAERVVDALAARDLETVASFVHPVQGVRFSPYAYVREAHQVFMPEDFIGLAESNTIYLWGYYDGSGEPIELTFNDYYARFVYSSDFANPEQMAVDARLGEGNSINNIHKFYPGSSYVEYHFGGFDEQYSGMDWQSLRLVFIEENGIWYLVGIVHDEWTI
jgi:hypothetical protein